MSESVRIVNTAIASIFLVSMIANTGTVAARGGSSRFAHARVAWPSGTSRYVSDNRASQPFAADRHSSSYSPAFAAEPLRQGASYDDPSRRKAWGAESKQPIHDYRQVRAENGYMQKPAVAPATAPIPVQPAYAANAATGYTTFASNNPLPMAGLLADTASALAEYMRADEMNETDSTYDEQN